MIDEKRTEYFISKFLAANEPWLVMEKFSAFTAMPYYFDGILCPHYAEYKKYERELERGTRYESGESRPSDNSVAGVRAWLDTLPVEAKVGGDYDGGLDARWDREVPLTDEEVAFRKKYMEENPIPAGEPDPMKLRWRRSVPFEAPVVQLVEGVAQDTRPPWTAEIVK